MKAALGITMVLMFFMAAYMHLIYSPHHQNQTYGYAADFRTQPYHNFSFSNDYKKVSICVFPVDFELPELKFDARGQIVIPFLDFLGQFESLSKKHFFEHTSTARSPPV